MLRTVRHFLRSSPDTMYAKNRDFGSLGFSANGNDAAPSAIPGMAERVNAKTACTLPAQQGIRAERLPVNASRKLRCTPAAVELLRTREGCLVRLSIGNRQFVTLSGRAELAQPLQTEWLIATPKKPETVRYQKLLALCSYSWMAPETQYTASLSLRRTGGERLG